MDEFFVVDRVENNIAVLECHDGKFLNVEVDSLPFKVWITTCWSVFSKS